MVKITLNDIDYKIIRGWGDISLQKAIEFNHIVAEMPKELEFIYREKDPEKRLKLVNNAEAEGLNVKEFPIFYEKVICKLSNIPVNILDLNQRIYLYKGQGTYSGVEKYVLDIYDNFSEDRKQCDSFEWGKGAMDENGFYIYKNGTYDIERKTNETYIMPLSESILGIKVPYSKETAGTFAETSDLMSVSQKLNAGKFDYVKNVVSILCRKKDEEYNEDIMLMRSNLFETLPMSIVWQVFFYIYLHISTSGRDMLTYLKAVTEGKLKVKRMSLIGTVT